MPNIVDFKGQLLAIAIAPAAKAPMASMASIEAAVDVGLLGDRYAAGLGVSQRRRRAVEQQVSLIAEESLSAANEQLLLPFEHLDSRRNLLTRGVPLNDLIDQPFWIGEVLLRGLQLCEPCGYLERMTQSGIQQILKGRGGLRAQILRGGQLKVGDEILAATTHEAHTLRRADR